MSPNIQTIKEGHNQLEISFQIVILNIVLENYDKVFQGEDGSPDYHTGGKETFRILYPKTTV